MWCTSRAPRRRLLVGLLCLLVGDIGRALEDPAAQGPQQALEAALQELRTGRMEAAQVQLEQICERWPGYRLAHYHLGRVALDRGNLPLARKHLEAATDGSYPQVFSAWYYLGRLQKLEREFAEAIASFDRSIELAPGFVPAQMERGVAHLFSGNAELGLTDLLAVAEKGEGPPLASLLAGEVLISLGRDSEARRLCAGLLTDAGEGEEVWGRQAEGCLRALEPGAAATRQLSFFLGQEPAEAVTYWALGEVSHEIDPGRAAALFEAAVHLDSENPAYWLSWSESVGHEAARLPAAMPHLPRALERMQRMMTEERVAESSEIARQLLAERPALVPALLVLGREAESSGDLWRAMEIYEYLLDRLGSIPAFEIDLARVAQTAEAHELAACAVERALEAGSEDPFLQYLVAAIEADRGNTDAAIEAARRAIELGSDDVRLRLKLGELYFEQMKISESITAYQEAMEMDPSAAEAVRPFALASLTTEQYASLRQVLESHIEAFPDNLNTLYSLGVMSLRDGRLEEAEEYLSRLAELAPDHGQVHYSLGQLYMRQGARERGEAEMQRFAEIKAAENEEWNRHNQAHFRRVEARKAAEEGRFEEAAALYEESVADGTAELTDYLEAAEARLKVSQADRAIRTYESVLSSFPYHRRALTGLAAAAAEAGDDRRRSDAEAKLRILNWSCQADNVEAEAGA